MNINQDVVFRLMAVATEAKEHYDNRSLPYPPHLQSFINYLDKPPVPADGVDGPQAASPEAKKEQ